MASNRAAHVESNTSTNELSLMATTPVPCLSSRYWLGHDSSQLLIQEYSSKLQTPFSSIVFLLSSSTFGHASSFGPLSPHCTPLSLCPSIAWARMPHLWVFQYTVFRSFTCGIDNRYMSILADVAALAYSPR